VAGAANRPAPEEPPPVRGPHPNASQVGVEWSTVTGGAAAARALVAALAIDHNWSSELPDPHTRSAVLTRVVTVLTLDAAQRGDLLTATHGTKGVGAACVWEPGYHPGPLRTRGYLLAGATIARHAAARTPRLLERWRCSTGSSTAWTRIAARRTWKQVASSCFRGTALLASPSATSFTFPAASQRGRCGVIQLRSQRCRVRVEQSGHRPTTVRCEISTVKPERRSMSLANSSTLASASSQRRPHLSQYRCPCSVAGVTWYSSRP
jgi:hypothetical protein